MTLAQLRVFLAVVRAGSFSAAAVALAMTQPSVSEVVRRLEEQYGVALFMRGSRRLTVTPAGETLLPLAEQVVEAADAADRALRSLVALAGGVAVFGLLRNANYYFLSRLLETFHARHPQVRLRILGLNSVEVAEDVLSGRLEAGLVVLPVEGSGLEITPLARDEVVFVTADPERAKHAVTMADLARTHLVLYDAHYGWRDPTRRQVAERAQQEGVTLQAHIEVEHVETALQLVAHGAGDTFVSRAVTRSPVFPAALHVTPFATPLHDTIALIQRSGAVLSPATREIAELAKSMLLDHVQPDGTLTS